MSLFDEYEYYSATLSLGVHNLLSNGFALGWKKTAGKIMQPMNSYTRFPEYYYLDRSIAWHLQASFPNCRPRILDVGSPKAFGLHLARSSNVEIEMTDVSPLNIEEYQLMWRAFRKKARGSAQFSIQDVRSLEYASNSFDVVYSMSVLEHVQGEDGDARAATELLRVLRPGGILLFSVPYGNVYVEQHRKGFKGAVERCGDNHMYFFQRIYDHPSLENRLFRALRGAQVRSEWTIWRLHQSLLRKWATLGEDLRGVLGFLNPVISWRVNRSLPGIAANIPSSYTELYSPSDTYGDVVIVAEKLPE